MPYLLIETNVPLSADRASGLAALASRRASELLGKDERWVMACVRGGAALVFGGTAAPCAYMELKSLGLSSDRAEALSAGLCELAKAELGVPPDRVYIEMGAPNPALWGWDGATFG